MQWCKLVRPDSGYKVFIHTETQNYAIKEDHIIVFENVQSLKEKVECTLSKIIEILKKNGIKKAFIFLEIFCKA